MIKLNYPNLLSYHRNTSLITQVKQDLDRVSTEAVTGLRSDITKAAQGDLGGMHLIKKALDDIDQSGRVNTIVSSRLSLSSQTIAAMREPISAINTTAILALASQGSTAIETVSDEARAAVHTVMASLNSRHGSRNLFSGDKIDTPPFSGVAKTLLADIDAIVAGAGSPADIMAALDDYFDDASGTFNTDIYQGSARDADKVRLSSGELVSAGLRGNDPAFKDALRGLAVLAAATQTGLDYAGADFADIFNQGISAISSGSGAMIELEGRLGIHQETISKLESRNTFESLTLGQAYQAVVGRDQYEAAAELKSLEVQLQSAFTITARMANLNLVNFLS